MNSARASGFLAGCADWASVLGADNVDERLRATSIPRLERLATIVDRHRRRCAARSGRRLCTGCRHAAHLRRRAHDNCRRARADEAPHAGLSRHTRAIFAGSLSGFSNATAGVGGPALAMFGAATNMPMSAAFVPTMQVVALLTNALSVAALPLPLVLAAVCCVLLGSLAATIRGVVALVV